MRSNKISNLVNKNNKSLLYLNNKEKLSNNLVDKSL